MLNNRLQILLDSERRRRLDAEARRRGVSVATVVREAIDAQLGGVSGEEKGRAIAEMRRHAPRAKAPEPDELNRLFDQARL